LQFADSITSQTPPTYIETSFKRLPCLQCTLPNDLRQLLCHLHNIDQTHLHPNHAINDSNITQAVQAAQIWRHDNPHWYAQMMERVIVNNDNNGISHAERMRQFATTTANRPRTEIDVQTAFDILTNMPNNSNKTVIDDNTECERFALMPPSYTEDTIMANGINHTSDNGQKQHMNGNAYELVGNPDELSLNEFDDDERQQLKHTDRH